jgi:hypothetical protein
MWKFQIDTISASCASLPGGGAVTSTRAIDAAILLYLPRHAAPQLVRPVDHRRGVGVQVVEASPRPDNHRAALPPSRQLQLLGLGWGQLTTVAAASRRCPLQSAAVCRWIRSSRRRRRRRRRMRRARRVRMASASPWASAPAAGPAACVLLLLLLLLLPETGVNDTPGVPSR